MTQQISNSLLLGLCLQVSVCIGKTYVPHMSDLFGFAVNTGIMASWILVYFAGSPHFKERATAELKSFLNSHSASASPSKNVYQSLSDIGPAAWEQELPFLDICIDETVRISAGGSRLRRVMGENVQFYGKKLELGSFVSFPAATMHLNPDIYSNPKV